MVEVIKDGNKRVSHFAVEEVMIDCSLSPFIHSSSCDESYISLFFISSFGEYILLYDMHTVMYM